MQGGKDQPFQRTGARGAWRGLAKWRELIWKKINPAFGAGQRSLSHRRAGQRLLLSSLIAEGVFVNADNGGKEQGKNEEDTNNQSHQADERNQTKNEKQAKYLPES